MMISFDFGIDLKEYADRGKNNSFPQLDYCPNCKCISYGNVHRNGYYWRFGITEELTIKIPICRMKCLICKVSISILPDFFIPYFQHTIRTVLDLIQEFIQKRKNNSSRQLLRFYFERYDRKLNWVHSFFTDIGHSTGLSSNRKKEAIKYLKMIRDFGESSFLRRSWGHLSTYFMAN
ncbi:hypothetical protein [Robertmurraya sp. FSL R5-0851]|uniref:hypothetical protein n=1 Tax=Robertmurraya sp. FSL R5-0851 TaxID=2921584 RepID=UPI0030FC5F46